MSLTKKFRNQAKKNLKTIVLAEGEEERIIRAAEILNAEKIVKPILIGNPDLISAKAETIQINLRNIQIIEPEKYYEFSRFCKLYYKLREHKGLKQSEAMHIMKNPLYFAAMIVHIGAADGAVAGSIHTTGDVLRAAIQIIGLAKDVNIVSSTFLMVLEDGKILSFADCAVIPDPNAEQLKSIAISTSNSHKKLLGEEPRVAMLSFSTKGSAQHPKTLKVLEATEMVKKSVPELKIDGELQFDAAYVNSVGKKKAPGSEVAGIANVFIFPDLDAGNIGYKLVQRLANAQAVGPIIQGLAKPYNDLSRGCSVDDIVDVASICSILT